jgi:hypothetical protein
MDLNPCEPRRARDPVRRPRGGALLVAALTAALALPAFTACGGVSPAPAPVDNLFTSSLWDDGRAEYSIYTGVTARYGQPRSTEARMIVVKEDLVRATLVKSDSGPIPRKTLPAIKLNFSADFQTGTYTYHQAATVMFDRSDMQPLKEVMAHHELCGITFVRVGPVNGRLVHEAHSYWDGEADRTVDVDFPAGVALWWDALPVSLRLWAGRTRPFEMPVWLLPSQISGQSPLASTRPIRATLRLVDVVPLQVPAGAFTAVKFAITTPTGSDLFWFDTRAPHPLLRLDTHEGRSLQLRKLLRLDYWNHHMNGDERLAD